MFENIRIVLDEFERICNKYNESKNDITESEKEFLDYFDMNFAKSMMQDIYSSDRIAKVILAYKDMLCDIKLKIK